MEQSSGFENSGFASKRKRTRKSTSLRKFGQRNGENNRTGLEEISPSIEVTAQSCFTFGNSRPFFYPAPATASLSDCIQESKPANSLRGETSMRILKLLCTFVFVALLFAMPSHAQRIELFGGYTFVRAPVTFSQTPQGACVITGCPTTFTTQNLNLNGWNVGGAFKVLGPLALKADFADTSGSFQGANTHLKTYLIGPQLRFPGPISPFAHFLIGGAHESTTSSIGPLITASPTRNAFATTLGGGLDLKVLPFISLRPIQIDYLLTHFNSNTQNQFRYSAGIVLRF